jgi:hypothetical protein
MHGRRLLDPAHVIQFPKICPACNSTARHELIPSSPEVETHRCDSCGHEWTTPAPPPMRPVPDSALPHDWFNPKKTKE